MNRHFLPTLLVIVSSLCCSGCWDARDIDTMSFPIAAAYDLHPGSVAGNDIPSAMKDQHYIDVTVLFPNLSPDSKDPVRIEKVSAPTTSLARTNRPLDSGLIYQPAAVQVVILGKELAEIGVGPYLDSLFRDPIIPTFINLAVVSGRGEDVLLTPVEDFTHAGVLLRLLLQDGSLESFVPKTTLHDWGISQTPGKNPVLPVLEKTGESGIHITGSAIFDKDRLVSILDLIQTRSLVLLRGINSQGYIPFRITDGAMVTDTGTVFVENQRKVTVTRSGDHYIFRIKITLEGILEDHSNLKVIDTSYLKVIEEQVAADIRRECDSFIHEVQENYKVDCIDVSKYALAKWRWELTPMIDKGFIENAEIHVEVKVSLKNAGETT